MDTTAKIRETLISKFYEVDGQLADTIDVAATRVVIVRTRQAEPIMPAGTVALSMREKGTGNVVVGLVRNGAPVLVRLPMEKVETLR